MLERDGPRPDLDLAPVHARVELGDVGEAESAALGAVYAQPLVAHHVDRPGEDDPPGAHVEPRYYVVACELNDLTLLNRLQLQSAMMKH